MAPTPYKKTVSISPFNHLNGSLGTPDVSLFKYPCQAEEQKPMFALTSLCNLVSFFCALTMVQAIPQSVMGRENKS